MILAELGIAPGDVLGVERSARAGGRAAPAIAGVLPARRPQRASRAPARRGDPRRRRRRAGDRGARRALPRDQRGDGAVGGLDAAETNFLGRGIALGAGFVQSTKPAVAEAVAGRRSRCARRGRLGGAPGSRCRATSSTATAASSSRRAARPTTSTPRTGSPCARGGLGARWAWARICRARRGCRPRGASSRSRPRFPACARGTSAAGRRAPSASTCTRVQPPRGADRPLDLDTRSDPVLPSSGRRLAVAAGRRAATVRLGLRLRQGRWPGLVLITGLRAPRDRVPRLHGGDVRDAPYFNRFFVGDPTSCCRLGRWG